MPYAIVLLLVIGLLTLLSGVRPAAAVTLQWVNPTENVDQSPLTDLAHLVVLYGTATGQYDTEHQAGLVTSTTIEGLPPGVTFYFVVVAIDTSGNRSPYSPEVPYTEPLDTTPPTVGSPSIPDGATGVNPGSTLTATFSEAMDATTINTSTVTLTGPGGTAVPLAVTYNASTRVLTVDPTNVLAANTTYTLTLNGLTDTAGNPLATVSIQFTTGEVTIPGLVLGYPLDAGAGTTAADVSGRQKAATLINGPQWVQGVSGSAVRLDGQNDYAQVTSPKHPTGHWTWALWMYPEMITGWRGVMEIQTSASKGVAIGLTEGQLEVWYGGTRRLPPVGSIPASTWTHLTLIREGSQLRLYVNAQQVSSASGATKLSFGSCPLLFGVDADSGCTGAKHGYFLGRLDDVRVYNRALTLTEVATVMQTPLQP